MTTTVVPLQPKRLGEMLQFARGLNEFKKVGSSFGERFGAPLPAAPVTPEQKTVAFAINLNRTHKAQLKLREMLGQQKPTEPKIAETGELQSPRASPFAHLTTLFEHAQASMGAAETTEFIGGQAHEQPDLGEQTNFRGNKYTLGIEN